MAPQDDEVRESFASKLVPAPGGEFAALLPEGYSADAAQPYLLIIHLHGGGQDREVLLNQDKETWLDAIRSGGLPPCVRLLSPSKMGLAAGALGRAEGVGECPDPF